MSSPQPATLVALLHGPDHTGIVARTAGWIFARQGNILHADQHRDMEAGEFFQRIEWVPAGSDAAKETSKGVATFSNLKINGVGTFRIRFTSPGLQSVTSSTIDVKDR